jgi:acyl carrier protein
VAAVLRAIWHDVVGAEPADATNFLAIGGNSIMAVQLAGRVKDRLGVRAEPSEVLLSDSFAGLVEKIRAAAPSA